MQQRYYKPIQVERLQEWFGEDITNSIFTRPVFEDMRYRIKIGYRECLRSLDENINHLPKSQTYVISFKCVNIHKNKKRDVLASLVDVVPTITTWIEHTLRGVITNSNLTKYVNSIDRVTTDNFRDKQFIPDIYRQYTSLESLAAKSIKLDIPWSKMLLLKNRGIFRDIEYILVKKAVSPCWNYVAALVRSTRIYERRINSFDNAELADRKLYLICLIYSNRGTYAVKYKVSLLYMYMITSVVSLG